MRGWHDDYPIPELLDLIWSRSEGGFVFMPRKYFGRWQETPAIPTSEISAANIRSLIRDEVGNDSYFSARSFTGGRRVEQNAGPSSVLYADLDAVAPDTVPIMPSVAWETSPGSYQAIWFLDTMLPADEHAVLNRALSKFVGADMNSYISTKVLRIPGTLNWKRRRGITPVRGRLLWVFERLFQSPGDISEALPIEEARREIEAVTIPPPNKRSMLRHDYWGGLSLRLRSAISKKAVPDRSGHIRMVAKQLAREGVPISAAFAYIEPRPWNKWAFDQNKLMAQIADAYAAVEDNYLEGVHLL